VDHTAEEVVAGKYRILRLLGDGAMGSVFEAWHEGLNVSVAVKILHPHLARIGDRVERFAREARAAARIRNPHVVQVFDVDRTTEGLPFLVMEYVQGRTLRSVLKDARAKGSRVPPSEAIAWMVQVCDGVEAAHRAGIVHRDLKPDNVLVHHASNGALTLQVMDFGIAKLKFENAFGLTAPGTVMGTPQYMAPEQLHAPERVDERADVFSLGVMLFELLGGRRPVESENPWQISTQYAAGEVARIETLVPEIHPELAQAVHRALAAAPEGRFASAGALRAAIEWFAGPAPVTAETTGNLDQPQAPPIHPAPVIKTVNEAPAPLPVAPPYPAPPPRRGARISSLRLVFLTLVLAIVGFLAGILWYYLAHSGERRRKRAPAGKRRT